MCSPVIRRVENLIKIFSELPYNHEKEIKLCAVDFIGCHNDLGGRRKKGSDDTIEDKNCPSLIQSSASVRGRRRTNPLEPRSNLI